MNIIYVILLTFCFLFQNSCTLKNTDKNQVKAIGGTLDLRDWDFKTDGPVSLNGEWEFYWKNFLTEKDLTRNKYKPDYVTVPGEWSTYKEGEKKLTSRGYATYRLKILLKKNAGQNDGTNSPLDTMTLQFPQIFTSFVIYINGFEAGSIGKVGRNSLEANPMYGKKNIEFYNNSNELNIIIHVSNYDYMFGGINYDIVLGESNQIRNTVTRNIAFELFAFGGILIIGLYYLAFFFIRSKEVSLLLFSILCFLILASIVLRGDFFILQILDNIPFKIYFKTNRVVSLLSVLFLIRYLYSVFPKKMNPLFVRITGAFIYIDIFLTLFPVTEETFFISEALIPFIGVYAIYILFKLTKTKEDDAILFLLGISILFLSTINDILHIYLIAKSTLKSHIGFLFFILIQAIFLAKRFSRAFTTVEAMSVVLEEKNIELQDLNLNLEKKVDERTRELQQSTFKLERAYEKLKELDRAKTNFFANISHELRTPLTLILSPLRSILNGDRGNVINNDDNYIYSIYKNGMSLLRLINDLLDFSKIEAGKMTLRKKRTNITELLNFYISSISSTAESKGLKLIFTNNAGEYTATIDRDLIEKAVYNLISNSIKFTPSGGLIKITLDRDEDNFSISVKDTGIGIPKDKFDIIFSRFGQVDSSSTKKYDGTGIGLSLAKEIVEMHNGDITVRSEVGAGSEFTIIIPVADNDKKNDQPAAGTSDDQGIDIYNNLSLNGSLFSNQHYTVNKENEDETESIHISPSKNDDDGEKNTILLVDDNPDMINFLTSILEHDHDILVTYNGKKALEVINSGNHEIDLILADVMMPEMDGYEMTEKVRENPDFNGVPIILLTAKAEESMKIEGIEKGAMDYITKPFNPRELQARINTQLELKSMRDKLLAENRRLYKKLEDFKKDFKEEDNPELGEDSREKLEKITEFIHENFNRDISREGMASAIGISPDYLSRIFNRYTGKKIRDYINELRIKEAGQRLRDSNDDIMTIAYEVGFENIRTFNRVFIKINGMTPTEYRNSINTR